MMTSVVITAYNLEKYIREAIDSVLMQTKRPDEIIVVDDCSTDNTAAIIQSYGNQLKFLEMPQNSGGLTATFTGLKKASGEVVFFLDGDDIWLPDKIESVLPLYEKDERLAIVSHNYIRVDDKRKDLKIVDDTHENIARILSVSTNKVQLSEALKDSILGKTGFWCGSAYSLRKRYVDITQFENWMKEFPHTRFTYLDLVLPTFILINNPDVSIGYIDKVLFEYRIHTNNTSGNKIPTIDAAKKALRMGHCTTMATYGMFRNLPSYKKYSQRQELMIREYEYLNQVYNNEKLKAFKNYVYLCKHHWTIKKIIKESQRLTLSLLFGPTFFLKLRAKLS